MLLFLLGLVVALLGVLGLFHVLGLGVAVSVILLVVGAVILVISEPVRRRF